MSVEYHRAPWMQASRSNISISRASCVAPHGSEAEAGPRRQNSKQNTVFTQIWSNWSAVRNRKQKEPLAGNSLPFWWTRPSSPLSGRACLIESSWRGFWAEMCGSSQRDSGSRSVPELHSLFFLFFFFGHTWTFFIQVADISYCKMRGKSDCLELLEGKRESCGSGFDYIRWQCAIFTPHFFHFLPTLWFSYANGWSGLISPDSIVCVCACGGVI